MINLKSILTEKYEIDLEIGDTILRGKFKNKAVVVKDFGVDDKGQPTINGKKMLSFRIKKLMPAKIKEETDMIKLKDLVNEAEKFKAKSKETGKTVVYKSKESMEKAIEDGRAEDYEDPKKKDSDEKKPKVDPQAVSFDRASTDDKPKATEKPKVDLKSPYGAKQPGLGAGEKNLKGPKSDADSLGGDAKQEQALLKSIRAIEPGKGVDLCTYTVPGTNMFCAGNKGIERKDMPQLKSVPEPGGKADKLVKAGKLEADPKTGEVNTEDIFKGMLKKEGISMSDPTPVKVSELKATQNQLEGDKVIQFAKVLAGDQPFDPPKTLSPEALKGWQDALREPIIVSEEGYILDGHHRWAALVQHDLANGGGADIEMDVKRVDMKAEALVDKTNKFTTDMGLAVKTKEPEKPKKENFESQILSKLNELEKTGNCCGVNSLNEYAPSIKDVKKANKITLMNGATFKRKNGKWTSKGISNAFDDKVMAGFIDDAGGNRPVYEANVNWSTLHKDNSKQKVLDAIEVVKKNKAGSKRKNAMSYILARAKDASNGTSPRTYKQALQMLDMEE